MRPMMRPMMRPWMRAPMSYSLIFTESYEKIERSFLKRHPDLRERYHKTLAILEQDPLHPSLRLHALEGRLAGLHAIAINLQYRITLELEVREEETILVSVGSHGEVY
jgi:mRNA-degrading endonuclease YafQ of YafQ-DinJ toxin-antitoxin module